jgi:hypothetical protein
MKKFGLFKHAAVLLLVGNNKTTASKNNGGVLSDKRRKRLIKGRLSLSGGLIHGRQRVFVTDILKAGQQFAGDFDVFGKHAKWPGPQAKVAIQGTVNNQPLFSFTVACYIYNLIIGTFVVLVIAGF